MSAGGSLASRSPYTAKQGQYLAFIHAYQKMHRRAPSEADLQQYFRVSPPSVHDMILRLGGTRIDRESARTGAVHPDSAPAGAVAGIGVLIQQNRRAMSVNIGAVQESRDQAATKILLQGRYKNLVVRSSARE
jgi:hypothetical protein